MSTPINEQEYIQLNAYLDGELSAGERELFEQRLAGDPSLQAELRALRATKMLLGMAERQRVPRNFTLDPAVYGKPARPSLWERLGLARIPSWAVATAALVVVVAFVGLLVLNNPGGGTMTADVAMEARTAEDSGETFAQGAEAVEEAAEPVEEAAAADTDGAAEVQPFEAEMAEEEAAEEPAAAEMAPDEAAAADMYEEPLSGMPDGLGSGAGGGLPPAPTVVGPAEGGETPNAALAVPPVGDAAESAEAGDMMAQEAAESAITEEEANQQETPQQPQAVKVTGQPPAAQTAEAAEAARQMRQPRTMLIVGLAAAVVAALLIGIWMAVRANRH